jgi:hypothetical protein
MVHVKCNGAPVWLQDGERPAPNVRDDQLPRGTVVCQSALHISELQNSVTIIMPRWLANILY